VVLAGQVGVADHVTLGDGVVAGAQAGIPSSLEAGARVFGTPARPVGQARRIIAAETRLPELLQRVRALERRLERLAAQLGDAGGTGDARE
jgi:UDP-3-O-[3-hydroxymyristoyl] glucosamine N-acyltransferase